jgi:hypothetical protein
MEVMSPQQQPSLLFDKRWGCRLLFAHGRQQPQYDHPPLERKAGADMIRTHLLPYKVLRFFCGPTFLHAHSYQAAQQDFYEACKTAKALKKSSPTARYPYKRKWYHTTTWKNTGIKVQGNQMRLALAQG